ncbi:MAG TPA: hypothetical protein VFI90_03030 [Rubrobacter sp.]|nr:hypothetical protein [Rubrobacter sp.]
MRPGGDCHFGHFTFVNHQPMTQVMDAVRAFLLGQPADSHGWQALAWCLGILVVFIPLSPSTGSSQRAEGTSGTGV